MLKGWSKKDITWQNCFIVYYMGIYRMENKAELHLNFSANPEIFNHEKVCIASVNVHENESMYNVT